VSDTPTTGVAQATPDGELRRQILSHFVPKNEREWWAARAIERLEFELNAANDRIKRLEAVVNDPHALWTNWLRGDVKLPAGIGDVRQYQDHIKRLEEAGDAMADVLVWSSGTQYKRSPTASKWRKAKEAKL